MAIVFERKAVLSLGIALTLMVSLMFFIASLNTLVPEVVPLNILSVATSAVAFLGLLAVLLSFVRGYLE